MGSYSVHWEPIYTTLNLQSYVALLGTQLMAYGPTYQILFFLTSYQTDHMTMCTLPHCE